MSDHWEFYFTVPQDAPAAILVDMGIADEAPRAELSQLVTLRIPVLNPDEHGLPNEDEHETLDRMEDALEEGLAELDNEVDYVGRITMSGSRVMFYYAADPAEVEAGLKATMESYAPYEFELQTDADPEWSRYFEMLYPSDRDQQLIGNTHILESLQQAGDKNEIEREVIHWSYFPTAENRAAFESLIKERGYLKVDQQDQSTGDNPFSLGYSRISAIDFETMNETVLELYDLVDENNGEYAGWETTVQKG